MSAAKGLPTRVQSVPEALAYWAERTPDAIALLAPDREPATYRELQEAVDRLAGELRAFGLGRRDGIALLLPDGPDLSVTLLASMAVGIAVPLLWPNPEAEQARILANPRLRAVVSDATWASSLEQRDCRLPALTIVPGQSNHIGDFHLVGCAVGGMTPATLPGPEDIAVILHSSGTTGPPKLVPRLHRNLIATCRVLVDARQFTPADRGLSLSRLAYSQAQLILTTAIYSGSSVICVPELDAAALPGWLRDYRPTYISTTPAILRVLAEGREELRIALHQSPLRFIVSSAGPLSTDEVSRLESILGALILNTYGMSEASFIASDSFPKQRQVPGTVGLVRCELRTVDEDGRPLSRRETGEIVIRGPRVVPGYLDDPEANAAAFLPGGWFRTGDVGFVDEAGYLHLTGRLGETINRGGEKIIPAEVDETLLSHPAVAEAAVFAIPDDLLGQDVIAAVALKTAMTATPRDLRAWMLDRLAPHKVPRRIWFVSVLPRTSTGKVRRSELARRWAQERE